MKTITSRILFLIGFLIVWETVYKMQFFSPLLFPSIFTIYDSFVKGMVSGDLLIRTYNSLRLILLGMFIGIVLAFLLASISVINSFFHGFVENIIVFLYPIPGIALFPLTILWFGIGEGSILFIILHSVIWSILLNVLSSIRSIPEIYIEVGLNLELNKIRLVTDIYIPACVPQIIAGLKIALGRAWRTAIAAEMVFGVVGNLAGLGWYMSYARNSLDIAGLLSGLIVIIVIGIFFEDVVFNIIENATVRKWGMI